MKEYDVKITETLEKTVTVQAESHDAAEEQVRAAYYNSEYILDSENFTGVAFGTTEEREVQKEQADTMNVLLVKPFMYPQAVQIGCELEDLQKAVGGDIEATYPFNEPVALVMPCMRSSKRTTPMPVPIPFPVGNRKGQSRKNMLPPKPVRIPLRQRLLHLRVQARQRAKQLREPRTSQKE